MAAVILALVLWFGGPGHFARTNAAVQDVASLAAIGRWPWRRALHAQLLHQIAQQAPLVIGMDILMKTPTAKQTL